MMCHITANANVKANSLWLRLMPITELSVYRTANFGKSSGELNHHTCNDGKRRLLVVAALYMKMAVCPRELYSFQSVTLKKFCVYSNQIDALFSLSLLN
jgi:hypothetical protein